MKYKAISIIKIINVQNWDIEDISWCDIYDFGHVSILVLFGYFFIKLYFLTIGIKRSFLQIIISIIV